MNFKKRLKSIETTHHRQATGFDLIFDLILILILIFLHSELISMLQLSHHHCQICPQKALMTNRGGKEGMKVKTNEVKGTINWGKKKSQIITKSGRLVHSSLSGK